LLSEAADDVGVGLIGDPGGDAEPVPSPPVFHWRPSMGRYVFTFSPMHDR
jgi:hypothetical protein